MAGHSYGEYVALMAAGAWDLERAMLVTRARCDAVGASKTGQGAMLATTATAQTVEQLSARLEEPVYVANYNAPDQVVVGGRRGPIADLAELLHTGRISGENLERARRLPHAVAERRRRRAGVGSPAHAFRSAERALCHGR